MEKSRTLRKAFTLVELLTVVAVLAILGSLLIAVIGGVKAKAHQAACASNMRQIGFGLQLYANDHGEYPKANTTDLNESWIYTLSDYLEDLDEVRICPVDPKADKRLKAGGTSYILNSNVFAADQTLDPFGNTVGKVYNRPSLIPNPAKTILAFNVSDSMPIGATNDHTHSSDWTGWSSVLRDIQPNRHGGRENDLTSGSANYLYADTHVESISAAAVKEKIVNGDNIAAVQ